MIQPENGTPCSSKWGTETSLYTTGSDLQDRVSVDEREVKGSVRTGQATIHPRKEERAWVDTHSVCVCVCVCVCVWFVIYIGHFLTKESTRKLSKHGYQWEKKEMEQRRKTEARLPGTYKHPSFYCAVLPCAAHLLLFFVCVFSGSWHTIVFSFGCTTQWLHIYITFKPITPDQPSTQHMLRFSQNEGQILHQQKTWAWLHWFETKPTMCPKYLAFVTM